MRIAMVMPGLRPDSLGWRVHRDFAAAVRQRGHEFQVLTTTREGDPPLESTEDLGTIGEPRGWRWASRPLAPLLRTRSLLPTAAAVARLLRRHGDDVDLLHVEIAYPHGAAVSLARRWVGWDGPVAVTPMGEDLLVVREASYGFRRHPVPRRLVEWTIREAAAVRCISPIVVDVVESLEPEGACRMIPLNVAQEVASRAHDPPEEIRARRRRARRQLDRRYDTAGHPVVLSLGRLHPFKGIDVLVEAMTELPRARLLIVGPSLSVRPGGDEAARLRGIGERLGVDDRIRIVGAVPPDRATTMLAAADAVAVPSHLESLNKVCVEAAAVGTPFVVTRTTGISAFLDGAAIGLTVAPQSPGALAEALDEILEGRFEYDPGAASAFVQRFSPRSVADRVVDLYEAVTGG